MLVAVTRPGDPPHGHKFTYIGQNSLTTSSCGSIYVPTSSHHIRNDTHYTSIFDKWIFAKLIISSVSIQTVIVSTQTNIIYYNIQLIKIIFVP